MSAIGGAMDVLLNYVMAELNKLNTGGLCAISRMAGAEVPLDYGQESCGGLLFVRLVSANPSVSFPGNDTTINSCSAMLAWPLEVGIFRPAPLAELVNDELILPTDTENSTAQEQQMLDLECMYRALIRLGNEEVEDLIIGSYTPQGPEGGVVGGRWGFTVGLE